MLSCKSRRGRLISSMLPAFLAIVIASAVPAQATEELPDIPLVFVKGGCFDMGDTFGDGGSDEKPVHRVCVDDFYMGKYEVTQEQWQTVMGNSPPFKTHGKTYPVDGVSWNDAREFIRRLNARTGLTWRMPTEAEWEFAARSGGKKQKFPGLNIESSVEDYAWCEANSGGKPHPVGQKKPNELGLYDMAGNVWEWVQDRYDRDYYRLSPKMDPQGDPFGVNRIIKGGSAVKSAGFLRASYRDYVAPETRGACFGLRLAMSAK